MNLNGSTFSTALVFFNQSDYLNHSHKDSNCLIAELALKINFVLNIESNVGGILY